MCALLDEKAKENSQVNKAKPLLVVFVIVLIGLGAVFAFDYFLGKEDLPLSVTVLVDPDSEAKGVLPHAIDSATEFEDSIDYLEPGFEAPEIRDTGVETTGEVVGVEAAPLPEPDAPKVSTIEPAKPKNVVVEDAAKPADVMVKPSSVKDLEITEKDWQGMVLVPDEAQMSKAYSSDVSLVRIEAHPLNNNRLRVWARVRNETPRLLKARVACNFNSTSEESEKTDFVYVEIPRSQAVDVYFVSPVPMVKAYTILVK